MTYYPYDTTPNALVGIQRHKALLRQCGLPIAIVQNAVRCGDKQHSGLINDRMSDLLALKRHQLDRLQAIIERLDDEILFLEHVPSLIDWQNEQLEEVA